MLFMENIYRLFLVIILSDWFMNTFRNDQIKTSVKVYYIDLEIWFDFSSFFSG